MIEHQANQIAKLQAENRRLSELRGTNQGPSANTKENLQRLRGEVTTLRNLTNDVARLQEENRELQAALVKAGHSQTNPGLRCAYQAQQLSANRRNQSKHWSAALIQFADSRDSDLTNLGQLTNYLPTEALADPSFSVGQYELVYRGPRSWMQGWEKSRFIALREKQLASGRARDGSGFTFFSTGAPSFSGRATVISLPGKKRDWLRRPRVYRDEAPICHHRRQRGCTTLASVSCPSRNASQAPSVANSG
ncbi:MAG: hypothetical protein IH623_04610 [Verrucomicrobia bacterium]|nr:hypothetical protein [Verrucomicrobiota bacterium]